MEIKRKVKFLPPQVHFQNPYDFGLNAGYDAGIMEIPVFTCMTDYRVNSNKICNLLVNIHHLICAIGCIKLSHPQSSIQCIICEWRSNKNQLYNDIRLFVHFYLQKFT